MPKRPHIRSARAGPRPAPRRHQGEGHTATSGRDSALARARSTVKCCQNPGQIKSESRSQRIRTGGQINRNPQTPDNLKVAGSNPAPASADRVSHAGGDFEPESRLEGELGYALVKARGGAVLADGDEAFGDHALALAAFERARELGWALFATPGLAAELSGPGSDVAPLNVAGLHAAAAAAGGAIELAPAAPARGRRWLFPAALGLAVLAAAAAWLERDTLTAWVSAPPPARMTPGPEPTVVTVGGWAAEDIVRDILLERPD